MRNIIGSFIIGVVLLIAGCSSSRDADTGETDLDAEPTYDNIAVISNRVIESALDTGVQQPTATPVGQAYIEQARAAELVLVNIYERVNPSVVNIEVVERDSFSDFIDSSGSGFVYDNQGHIITNAHVVIDAREILVTFSDGYVAEASIVGVDEYSDLAVIKVNDVDPIYLMPVELGDSTQIAVGQYVVAIGNPFGLRSSMTTGIISATGRTLDSEFLINPSNRATYSNPSIIQIDAAVNPGNSGGPILNLDGQVIGVATAIRSDNGTFQGIAYAVPVNTLRRVAPQLIETGRVAYPRLGIQTVDHTRPGMSMAALASELDLPVQRGILITNVFPDSPADDAGLRGGDPDNEITVRGTPVRVGGDIIVAIDDIFITDLDELLEYLVQYKSPGDEVILTVIRDGQTLEVSLILGER